jgi:hypothetical protein
MIIGILSIRDGWDRYLVILACLFGLWVQTTILWEEYRTHLHCKKRNREKQQEGGQPDKTAANALIPFGNNVCECAYFSREDCGGDDFFGKRRVVWVKGLCSKVGYKLVNLFAKLFFVHIRPRVDSKPVTPSSGDSKTGNHNL